MDPEARFRAWLRSIDRVFLPPRTQIMASAREMGLTPGRTQQILDSGQVPKGQVAFRLRLWSQAEIDLGFLHLNNSSFGAFLLGIPRPNLGSRQLRCLGPIRRRGGGKPAPPLPKITNKKIITKKITKTINDK